jgi:hypothetical protein
MGTEQEASGHGAREDDSRIRLQLSRGTGKAGVVANEKAGVQHILGAKTTEQVMEMIVLARNDQTLMARVVIAHRRQYDVAFAMLASMIGEYDSDTHWPTIAPSDTRPVDWQAYVLNLNAESHSADGQSAAANGQATGQDQAKESVTVLLCGSVLSEMEATLRA